MTPFRQGFSISALLIFVPNNSLLGVGAVLCIIEYWATSRPLLTGCWQYLPTVMSIKKSPDTAQCAQGMGGAECPWLRENHKRFWSVRFLLICGPRMSLALPLHYSNSWTISFPGSLITIIEMKLWLRSKIGHEVWTKQGDFYSV